MVQSRAGAPGTVGLVVRMPEDLRDRIKATADANGRSQNSEIVAALEEKFPPPPEGVTVEDISQWGLDILADKREGPRAKLIHEANKRLAADPQWKGWKLALTRSETANGEVLDIALYGPRMEVSAPDPKTGRREFKFTPDPSSSA